jgi:hypothetical protein
MQLSAATPRNVYKGVSNFFIFSRAKYLVHYSASFIIIIIATTTTIMIIIIQNLSKV